MKKLRLRTFNLTVLSLILIMVTSSAVFSQANIGSSKFLMLVETTDDGLKLTSEEGCVWKELTFSLQAGRSQAIDQYGTTFLDERKPIANKNLPDFILIFKKTADGITIEGKEGTAWEYLNFTCGKECHQYINFNGMKSKDKSKEQEYF